MQEAYKGYLLTKMRGGDVAVSKYTNGIRYHICWSSSIEAAKKSVDQLV